MQGFLLDCPASCVMDVAHMVKCLLQLSGPFGTLAQDMCCVSTGASGACFQDKAQHCTDIMLLWGRLKGPGRVCTVEAYVPDHVLSPIRQSMSCISQAVGLPLGVHACICSLCRMLGSSMTSLLELPGHGQWICEAKYNPHHDSLILSASSDCLVNLWHTPGIAGDSSASRGSAGARTLPTGATGPSKGFGKEAHDGKACTCDDHEDSVYSKPSLDNATVAALVCTVKMLLEHLVVARQHCQQVPGQTCFEPDDRHTQSRQHESFFEPHVGGFVFACCLEYDVVFSWEPR